MVIATRDRADELRVTLSRLMELRPRPPIVVVDNASTDHTQAVIDEVRTRSPTALRAVVLDHNAGAAARTVGARIADTEVVAFCDDDSWWAGDALSIAARLFARHPSMAVLAARTVVMPDGRTDPLCRLLSGSVLGTEDGLPGPSVLGFLACSALVRRRPFLDAGGFSPLLHFAGEEQLLAIDLAVAGWDLCYVDEVVAYHQPSANRPPSSARVRRELRNASLTTFLRRPVRRWPRAAATVARRVAEDPRMLPVLPELARRMPAVVRQRQRIPDRIERRIRLIETAPETA